jgi:hypothetical protein
MAMIAFAATRKRDRSSQADIVALLLKGISAEKIEPDGSSDGGADGGFAIARVHGLRLNTSELYSSTTEAIWEDGTTTSLQIGDFLESEGQRKMLKRCPSPPFLK